MVKKSISVTDQQDSWIKAQITVTSSNNDFSIGRTAAAISHR